MAFQKGKFMGLIIANKVTFHGNQLVKNLEKQILDRFYKDIAQKNNSETAIKRIFFGLDEESEFDWNEKTGAYWAYFQKRHDEIIFISGYPSIDELQKHLALHAAKIDPKVVVQLDYQDSEGVLIGTSLTAYLEGVGVKQFKEIKHTPHAENIGLSPRVIKGIKNSQRGNLRKQLITEMGSAYKFLKLT